MSEISVVVNGSTTINPTVGNGDTVEVTVTSSGERGPTGSQGSAGPANTLTIGQVSQGTASATITGTAPNQVLNLVLQKGDAGTEIELQSSSTHLQWRYVGGSSWTNLVALSAITGPTGSTGATGTAVELQASSTHIQWRYVGGSTWTNVIALSSLVGATGATGAQGPQGPAGSVNLADETPQPPGTASAGTALAAARADHVHAVGSITYSSLSGIPSTFTPAAHTQAISTVTGLQDALDGKQAAGSYATLVGGQVPSAQLPSFVDDVIDVGGTLPSTGDVGKIYVVSTGANINKIYRWSGSTFIEISPSPGTTDGMAEGSTNLYFTNTRAAAAAPVQSVAGRTGTVTLAKADVGLGNVDNTADTAKPISTATQTALDGKAATSHTHSLADITQSSATTGQVVAWNGTAWAAATPSGSGGSYTLPTATSSVLGGIKVGANLTITDGVLSATGGGGGSGSVTIGDPLWDSTVLMLHCNSLADSSSLNATPTAAGSAATTGSPKFGINSLTLDGNGDYVSYGSNPQFAFGTGDFTVECWFKAAESKDQYMMMIDTTEGMGFGFESGSFVVGRRGVATDHQYTYAPTVGTWTHYAACRSGSTIRLFINGTQVLSQTNTRDYTVTGPVIIGGIAALAAYSCNGQIDEFRVTRAARYTANFTPQTAAFVDGPSQTLTVTGSGGSGSSSLVTAASVSAFPATGSASNLYITTEDQRLWRWDATASIYVESGPIGGGFAFASVPASATASGTTGQVATDGSYWYYCSAPNTWVRTALTTWVNFTPATVSGLQLWLDASDAGTLYDATTGGSLVAADGAVARWQDKSGNSRHATQATSGDRPLRKAAIYGGKDALRFDGSSDWMSISGSASSLKCLHDGDSTLFLVTKLGASANPGHGRYTLLSNVRDGATTRVGVEINHRDSDPSTENDLLDVSVVKGLESNYPVYSANNNFFASGSVGVISAVLKPDDATSGNRVSLRRNGGAAVTANAPAGASQSVSSANADQDLNISRRPGDAYAADGFVNGDYCEIIIYDSALSNTDRAAVEGYLMTKWGIA